MDLNEIIRWVVSRGVSLLIGGAVILLLYRGGVSLVHRIVPSVLRTQAAHLPTGSTLSAEVDKRIATIEDLLIRLLRLSAVALLGALVLAVFDLWSILAGIVLIVVALLFATQDVVLDYVMGFLILVEGPYFKGDWVKVGAPGGVEGEVEEIGLRRTVLRDGMGSVHAVSNGLIRQSSNVTRVFSVATVEIAIPQARDLDRAIEAVARVAREMREDEAWADRFLPEAETDIWIIGIGIEGASVRIQQRVPTGTHGPVASELRRRLAAALGAASIGTGRWDTPLPITSEPSAGSQQNVARASRASGSRASAPSDVGHDKG
jgi:small conductance mechanosensitive channel